MPFAGPINAPAALNIIAAVRLRFMDAYSQTYQGREYSDYKSFVYFDDPAGDLIYSIYAHPMKPLRAWLGERPSTATDYRYWTQAVRTFADSMEIDVDDIKDDANPAKRQMYMMSAQRLAEAAAALWPSLVAETLIKGVTATWLPDGNQIFSNHPIDPTGVVSGNFRNYYANNGQGNNAAMPLTYGNLLTVLKNGYLFKAPTGLDYPIYYNTLVVPPSLLKTAQRLVQFDRLPIAEIEGQTLATTSLGGDALNEVKQSFGGTQVKVLANMPANMWSLIDTSKSSELPLAVKIRQPITWQYVGPQALDANGFPVSDEGMVPEMVFNRNKTKFGPKARGDGFFRNWWRVALMDGNTTPVTSLSIVS